MVFYNCSFCQYSTSNKNNYTKHLNTKKHLLIVSQKKQQNEENEEKNEENEEKEYLVIPNITILKHFVLKMTLKIFVNSAVRNFQEMTI